MKKRSKESWLSAVEYGHSLYGLTVNLIVHNMARTLEFQQHVLGADTLYEDPDFAVFEGYGSQWMVHADHTYDQNPIKDLLTLDQLRGGLVELRIHGCDPDRAEQQARQRGYQVIQSAIDKPHGLREAYLRDTEGYLWVPDQPTVSETLDT